MAIGQSFDVRFVYADDEKVRFRVLDVKDGLGTDVSEQVFQPNVYFSDINALRIVIAGTLRLEPGSIELRMIEDQSCFGV